MLRDRGVERGDRVAVVLPPTPETAAIFFGIWKHAALLLSMSVLYGDDGIRHRLDDSGAKVLVTDAANARPLRRTDDVLRARRRRRAARRAPRPSSRPPTPSADDPAQLYYTSGTTGWPRASCTPTATCSPTRSSSTATTCGTASASTAWASGRGRPASRRCSGPWRFGAVQCVYQREGGFDPHKQLDFLSRHEVTNVFTTPTAMRSMMAIADAGHALPAAVPRRLLGRRAAQPRGDPLVPRAVRPHGARLLRAHRVLSAGRQLPVHGGARGVDGPADARLGRADPRRGRAARWRRASAARSACARGRTRTIRSATGTTRRRREETFGGDWFHTKDAASHGRGRLRLVRGPRRRRDHRRRLPDRPVRGRVRVPRAPGGRARRRPSPRPTSAAGTSSRRSSCSPRATSPPTSCAERDPGRTCATTCRPTPTRAGSSSSTTCPRRSRARSGASSCARPSSRRRRQDELGPGRGAARTTR